MLLRNFLMQKTPKAAPESLLLKYGFFIFFKIFGTRFSALGTREGLLKPPETARRALGTEPPALSGTRFSALERPLGSWNGPPL